MGRFARLAGGFSAALAIAILACLVAAACGRKSPEVIVYCSLDSVYSEPILKDFERQTGIRVLSKFDTEATKTVGLANALLAEHQSGGVHCDVFWNNEIMQTLRLEDAGALEPYVSPSAEGIPAAFKDSAGRWTGFAARARVIVYNKKRVGEADRPTSIRDLADAKWKGKATIARPLAGTTATHATALFVTWGDETAARFFDAMLSNDIFIALGNGPVRDRVVMGESAIGLTDTDDVASAIARGDPVGMIFPDQGERGEGTLVFPNTVSLIAGAPHPDEGKKLIDYVLSAAVEERLAKCEGAFMPVRPGVPGGGIVPPLAGIKPLAVDFRELARRSERVSESLRKSFRR